MLDFSPINKARILAEAMRRAQLRAAGGPGSGNFGHAGRPGEIGGSGPSVSASSLDQRFPKAGAVVDGRDVLSGVPNESSIDSSLTDYEVLDGIREVQLSEFLDANQGPPKFYSATEEQRTNALAERIKASKQISPLIVVVDEDERGPYILEGGHRFDALRLIGAKSFPAKIVVDTSGLEILGGPGSGNFGHAGRPGEVGGSASGASALGHSLKGSINYSGNVFYTTRSEAETIQSKLGGETTLVKTTRGFKVQDAQGRDFGPDGWSGGDLATTSSGFPTGLKKIGEAKGSNPGGTYLDDAGHKWYVKQYRKPDQAATEQVANEVYKMIGVKVPHSTLSDDGKQIALKWEESKGTLGHVGVERDTANKILDGFVGDVFLMNWDAVGTGHDNVIVQAGNMPLRVDQGGTLMFRAQGELKPDNLLNKIDEWDTLQSRNSYYSAVFKSAGVKSADALGQRAIDQIDKVIAARPSDGWGSVVRAAAPKASGTFHARVTEMLEARQKGLEAKREELSLRLSPKVKTLGGPGSGNFGHAGRPGEVGGSASDLNTVSDSMRNPLLHKSIEITGDTDEDQEAIQEYIADRYPHEVVEAWSNAKKDDPGSVRSIPINQIDTAQATVSAEVLEKYKDLDPTKEAGAAIRYGRAFILTDGNHRVIALKKKGITHARIRVTADIPKKKITTLGGPGSGNFGHAGRPGEVGGSSSGGDLNSVSSVTDALSAPTSPDTWPISDDTVRFIGKNTPDVLEHNSYNWLENLDEHERNAINDYTQSGYEPINEFLRGDADVEDDPGAESEFTEANYYDRVVDEDLDYSARAITDALDKAPKPPPPQLVWRGLNAESVRQLRRVATGDVIRLDGFQSATIDPQVAQSWGSTLLEIKPKNGAYVKLLSDLQSEEEYLLPHGSKYKVRGVLTVKMRTAFSGELERQVIQLEQQ